MKYELLVMVKV